MANELNLLDWTVESYVEGYGENLAVASYNVEPDTCLKCGTVGELQRWGRNRMTVRDAPNYGKPTTIQVDRIRYKCMSCNGTFMQPLPDLDDRRMLTRRAVDYIARFCLEKPFAEIAKDVGIDEKTVRLVANERIAEFDHFPVFAPFYLGMDEVMVAGELRAIFTDLANRTILDLIESRKKPAVVHWLSHLSDRERVHVVCIDMWQPYRDAARAVLGRGVVVVVDKFHVVRLADQCLDAVRKKVGREKGIKGRRHLMRSRHVLLKRQSELKADELLTLSGWIENIPPLKDAYQAKEAFYRVYDIEDRNAARLALTSWEEGLSPDLRVAFKPLLTAVSNWRNEILAFWDHRVTNAYTEAMNGILKQINRRGRGYTFPIIRARILHGFQSKPPKGFLACENCGRTFPRGEVKAKYLMPLKQRTLVPDAKPYRLCRECHQTHIRAWMDGHGSPTLKSG